MAPGPTLAPWLDLDIPLPTHDLHEGDLPAYINTWATTLDGNHCDTCGYNPTDIYIGQRETNTWDLTVTVGCYAGIDLHNVTYEQARAALTDWHELDPTWIDTTLADMALTTGQEDPTDAPV